MEYANPATHRGPARISRKNQVTLPVSLLCKLGLGPGDAVDIADEGDHIVIRRHRSRFKDVTGTIPGFTDAVDVENSRDSWQ
ncbi:MULTISPECIES: AbrB/MazE/SpoVT family DNA-binding domain-containing protein [unclassified Microbispora]|uniref:AbrB/MazE/SpoVT family DNA-binding domain-containing protein n=1 Tax=unclassified Microbispora TaxID=2614687 RepID=UPI0015FF0930|nr:MULTISPECIES: AbrB/MazE/SpoVT family DNA-binding domain-containing protein [unclassified Microbispora]